MVDSGMMVSVIPVLVPAEVTEFTQSDGNLSSQTDGLWTTDTLDVLENDHIIL